jgi:hypothetical protein
MHMLANQPGVFERMSEELKASGESDDSVTPDQVRAALREKRIVARAHPQADLHLVAYMGQQIGNNTRMQWTIIRAEEGSFVTSDAPVVRHDPEFKGGLYGGGLYSSTAEVWFPLSKLACMVITHDHEGERRFFELLYAGRKREADAVREHLPAMAGLRVAIGEL